MGAALGIAERLLALEQAVAELRGVVMGATAVATAPPPVDPVPVVPVESGDTARLAELLGNTRMAGVLARAGYGSPEAVKAASDAALLEIDGIGDKALQVIREKVG